MTELPVQQLAFLCIAGFFLVILLSYYFYFFLKLNRYRPSVVSVNRPVSVIIAARNECDNLKQFLPSILEQRYKAFEVVVINDTSYDGTKDLLKEMEKEYSHLKVVTVDLDERFQKGKKFALTMGIKAARYDDLLFTDADCQPSSDQWIQEMMNAKGDKDIVLGYAPLNTKRSLLGSIIQYETFHTALQYLSYALQMKTYMGVGRNMGYSKSLFFKHKGFASHQHIMSGDDDLFIQEAATPDNVAICIDSGAHMRSDGPQSFPEWIRQKSRHLATSKLYKGRFKRLLGVYSLSHLLFYAFCIGFMCVFQSVWYYGAALMGFKWMVQYFIFFQPSKILGARRIGFFLPYYDVLYNLYLVLFSFIIQFKKPRTWK